MESWTHSVSGESSEDDSSMQLSAVFLTLGREALLPRAFSPKGLTQETTFPLGEGPFQLLEALTCRLAVGRAQVQQDPSAEATEGASINISCSHPNIQTGDGIHWYRQLPGQGPAFIASAFRGSKKVQDPPGTLFVAADRHSSVLQLARPLLRDAALYYCAVRDPAGQERLEILERSQHQEVMGTPSQLRMLPTAAEVEDPTVALCRKELRMVPGRATTTGGGSMTTVEAWHCLTQGSLQLLASGVGLQGQPGRHWL
ncbi:uncharacterized protein [Apteryx mantelli]|uniref:Uncharacterized protein isoform X2 n=1 Tax=Apteryx mantelli TaxID=2696672 RepID=A0ABM4FSM0_9AVES